MINLFYRIVVYLSRRCGLWVLYAAVWVIATGYFLFFPGRVAASVRFYRAVFPRRSRGYLIRCAWKQFHDFTTIYIDRYLLEFSGDLHYTAQGWEYIEKAVENGTGGILLMSHVGNWEVAARIFRKKGIPLLLFMGKKAGEQVEGIQKNTLEKSGVEIVARESGRDSPTDILEGMRYLRKGWILSMAGDRFGDPAQSRVDVEFMGHRVGLPEAPYALALATGAPVLVFFAFRTGRHTYHFVIHEPIHLRAGSRQLRRECVQRAAQQYARLLEQAVYRHPFAWHHFEPFPGPENAPENQPPGEA